MATHKAKVVFHPEVWKKIDWFTYNFKTEIGALGKVKQKIDSETKEKYFYVYDLLFPKQEVTGATVKFTPEMWGDLLKEHGLKGLSDIAFYWHRHPGNSAHSGTDDEDTFETFMSKEANRKYFIFLQTAVGTSGWNEEARIDLRLPVRHTITDSGISIQVEETPEEEALAKECEAIAEKVIVKQKPVTAFTTWKGQTTANYHAGKNFKSNETGWNKFTNAVQSYGGQKDIDEAVEKGVYGVIEGTEYMNNDIINGYPTSDEEKVSIKFENGQATIIAGRYYGDVLEKVLNNKQDGKLSKYVRSWKKNKSNTKGLNKYNLQPVSKKYLEMKTSLIRSYFVFTSGLLKKIEAENKGDDETLELTITNIEANDNKTLEPGKDFLQVVGKEEVDYVLDNLEIESGISWDNVYQATIFDMDYSETLGQLWINEENDKLHVKGEQLVTLVGDIQYVLREELEADEKDEMEEESEEEE